MNGFWLVIVGCLAAAVVVTFGIIFIDKNFQRWFLKLKMKVSPKTGTKTTVDRDTKTAKKTMDDFHEAIKILDLPIIVSSLGVVPNNIDLVLLTAQRINNERECKKNQVNIDLIKIDSDYLAYKRLACKPFFYHQEAMLMRENLIDRYMSENVQGCEKLCFECLCEKNDRLKSNNLKSTPNNSKNEK